MYFKFRRNQSNKDSFLFAEIAYIAVKAVRGFSESGFHWKAKGDGQLSEPVGGGEWRKGHSKNSGSALLCHWEWKEEEKTSFSCFPCCGSSPCSINSWLSVLTCVGFQVQSWVTHESLLGQNDRNWNYFLTCGTVWRSSRICVCECSHSAPSGVSRGSVPMAPVSQLHHRHPTFRLAILWIFSSLFQVASRFPHWQDCVDQ